MVTVFVTVLSVPVLVRCVPVCAACAALSPILRMSRVSVGIPDGEAMEDSDNKSDSVKSDRNLACLTRGASRRTPFFLLRSANVTAMHRT